jgi:hypothetical protein
MAEARIVVNKRFLDAISRNDGAQGIGCFPKWIVKSQEEWWEKKM